MPWEVTGMQVSETKLEVTQSRVKLKRKTSDCDWSISTLRHQKYDEKWVGKILKEKQERMISQTP